MIRSNTLPFTLTFLIPQKMPVRILSVQFHPGKNKARFVQLHTAPRIRRPGRSGAAAPLGKPLERASAPTCPCQDQRPRTWQPVHVVVSALREPSLFNPPMVSKTPGPRDPAWPWALNTMHLGPCNDAPDGDCAASVRRREMGPCSRTRNFHLFQGLSTLQIVSGPAPPVSAEGHVPSPTWPTNLVVRVRTPCRHCADGHDALLAAVSMPQT